MLRYVIGFLNVLIEVQYEIRYGEAELKLPEDVDLKAVAILLNALRRHN